MEKNWKQNAGLFFTKLLVKSFRFVPFWWLHVLSGFLAFVLWHVMRYRKKIILQNLRNSFPERNESELSALVTSFYRHLSDVVLEGIKGLTMTKVQLQQRFVYRNPEIFTPLYEKAQSAILLGSHFGNWEWGVLSFPLSVNHEVFGIYKPLKNRILDNYLNSLRKQWGLQLASMSQAGRAIVQQKGKPTIFVLIADQTPSDIKNAQWVNFLNQETPFLHGMDKLARQTGLPVFYFEIGRVERSKYEVSFSPLCMANEALKEGEVTLRFAEALEKTIRTNPSDWLWSHRRWKRADRKP